MLELPILAIFAICIFGMIKTSKTSEKRVKLPIWEKENGKEEMKIWLTGFLAKMKRTSTRTQKCRLILSVERMTFEDNINAVMWEQGSKSARKKGTQKPSYNWNAAASSANALIVLSFFTFAFLIAVLYFLGSCVFNY
jgi:hypothetical protein